MKTENLIKVGYHINSDIDIYVKEKLITETYTENAFGFQKERQVQKRHYDKGETLIYKTGGEFKKSKVLKDSEGDLYFLDGDRKISAREIFVGP